MFTSMNRGVGGTRPRGSGRFAVLLALIALFAFAIPASANATRTPFSAEGQVVGAIDTGKTWESGGILQVRNYQPVVAMTIDAEGFPDTGVAYGSVNFNLDQRTGHGRVWGTTVLEIGDGGFDCTASGDIRPASVPGGLLGEFETVCHGFGEYERVQMRGTVIEQIRAGQQNFEGFSFVTGDR